jgi:Rps23 Pro-64 3,4-dihydroxylase Tpa1-like proline 4-hydroxylase
MTPKQILDSFSETLMQDERILSAQERTLLSTLLQHAKSSTTENLEVQEAVRKVIASAIGETVAQRAFSVLGGSIVERLLESGSAITSDSTLRSADTHSGKAPQPPGKGPMKSPGVPGTPGSPNEPQPPGVREPGKEPHGPVRDTPGPVEPQPPASPVRTPGVPAPGTPGSPNEPQPPAVRAPRKESHPVSTQETSSTGVAIAERPAGLPAKCVVLDEFLAPQELDHLMRFTLEHQANFTASEVISPSADGGAVNYEHRRSRVLMDLAEHQDLVLARIKAVLPQVLQTLGMEEFSISGVEFQVTASNDGDFFHFHSDNGSERVALRHLTFVYFFHREPRQFEGGELRIHDAGLENGAYVSAGTYQTIVPNQNQIVFFPCELLHEITAVTCPSGLFADSRFTLNGWLRQ